MKTKPKKNDKKIDAWLRIHAALYVSSLLAESEELKNVILYLKNDIIPDEIKALEEQNEK